MITFATQERIDVLTEKFEELTEGMDNWKMPIKTVVNVSELDDMCDACEWFTGSKLMVVKQVSCDPTDTDFGKMKVFAEGYYNAIGS